MGTIQTTQPGGAGTFTGSGTAFPGSALYFAYIGTTTTYTWSLQSKPADSSASIVAWTRGPTGTTGRLLPDINGDYVVRFTDSLSATTDVTITVKLDPATDIYYLPYNGGPIVIAVPNTTGQDGKDFFFFGQNTDSSGTFYSGGKVGIYGGRGQDTRGVEIGERQPDSDTDVWIACQFFTQGGHIGQMTCHGGSDSAFRFRFDPGGGAGISQAQFLGGTSTLFFYDAGTDHVMRCSDGASMGANERLRLSRTGIGFNGVAPIAKRTITGSRANTEQALKDLLQWAEDIGLITDSTTA